MGLTASTVRQPGGGQGERTVETRNEARPSVWLQLYGEWSDRLARTCAIAAKLGIAERHVALAERLGGLLADTIRAVLNDLDLSDRQREIAASSVPKHLRLVAGALDEGEAS